MDAAHQQRDVGAADKGRRGGERGAEAAWATACSRFSCPTSSTRRTARCRTASTCGRRQSAAASRVHGQGVRGVDGSGPRPPQVHERLLGPRQVRAQLVPLRRRVVGHRLLVRRGAVHGGGAAGAGAGGAALPAPARAAAPKPRIYVYDLPPRFTSWLGAFRRGDWTRDHWYGVDVILHKQLLASSHRTHDPEEADFFFIPLHLSLAIHPPLLLQALHRAQRQAAARRPQVREHDVAVPPPPSQTPRDGDDAGPGEPLRARPRPRGGAAHLPPPLGRALQPPVGRRRRVPVPRRQWGAGRPPRVARRHRASLPRRAGAAQPVDRRSREELPERRAPLLRRAGGVRRRRSASCATTFRTASSFRAR